MNGENRTSRRSVLKSFGATALGTLGYAAAGPAAVEAAGEQVMLQYFHEDWQTATNDLSTVSDVGYDGVWLQQPAKAKLDWSDKGGRNDPALGYQPIDFRTFDSAFGTESDLRTLIDTAHAPSNDVEIYLDTVMNHMATGQDPKYDFPAFSYPDFHHDDNPTEKTRELLGLPDLKQESSYVRGELYDYMKKISDFGADGYRFDAAHHIFEWFFDDYANPWAENDFGGMFRVAEVLKGDVSYAQNYADTGMNVLDYPLFFTLRDACSYGDMSQLKNAGLVAQDPFHAVPFVDNHDQDPPDQYELAYAYVTTIEGYPVHYNLYPSWLLDNSNINNMVWVKKNLAGGETYYRHASNDLLVYERYNNLLVGLNNNTSNWKSEWVYTSWNNTTLHDYSGNASDISTDGNGWVNISVPPEGWVFYAPY